MSQSKTQEMFISLTKNAFNFLEKSILELKKYPKYSLINFHAAIELFLKARLMLEHWTIVVSKPENANFTKFHIGDFQSINMEEAIKRLENIAEQSLSNEAKQCFDSIRKKRNKMVHFYEENGIIEEVVAEELKGWFFLHKLLTENWKEDFLYFSNSINEVNTLMHSNREFLRVKFEQLQRIIADKLKEGVRFRTCPVCKFNALQELKYDYLYVIEKCLVCSLDNKRLQLECPQCNNKILIADMGRGICEECGDLNLDDLCSLFDGRTSRDIQHGELSSLAYCNECTYVGQPTLIEINYDDWVCLYCLNEHSRPKRCDYCGELVTGNLDDSYLTGCGVCDGRMGYGFSDE